MTTRQSFPQAEKSRTTDEVARLFRVSVKTVRSWATKGLIGHHRVGGGELRFTDSDIEGFIERSRIRRPR